MKAINEENARGREEKRKKQQQQQKARRQKNNGEIGLEAIFFDQSDLINLVKCHSLALVQHVLSLSATSGFGPHHPGHSSSPLTFPCRKPWVEADAKLSISTSITAKAQAAVVGVVQSSLIQLSNNE